MFSVFDHVTGRLISRLRPFADGPRHAGQFSALAFVPPENPRRDLTPNPQALIP